MTLAEFYAARLDEDEAAARAAGGALPWRAVLTDDPETTLVLDADQSTVAGWLDAGEAAHIARHDPARVLREVEAGRKLLAAYEHACDLTPGSYKHGAGEALEEALSIRAEVWSDHPDFDETWKAWTR